MLKIKFFREQDLIERIKANDRAVLGEIFVRYEKMIFSYIKTHGGSNADAEDVLQESIIVLWQNVCSGSFELSSKIGTYLMGVAKNKWREQLRKRKNTFPLNEQTDLQDQEKRVMDIILTQEKVELIQRALNAITPLCKKLLMLFYFEERSMDEIATILEFANTDVVKSKKYQCKKALEETLRKLEGDVNGL
jgi:RNA polymerase sigma factor (sigma-70 family)